MESHNPVMFQTTNQYSSENHTGRRRLLPGSLVDGRKPQGLTPPAASQADGPWEWGNAWSLSMNKLGGIYIGFNMIEWDLIGFNVSFNGICSLG